MCKMKIMKTKRSWGLLLGFIFAAIAMSGAMAQGHGHDRGNGHTKRGQGKQEYSHSGKSSLANRVYHITGADSVQKIKMKPVLDKATKRLEALRTSYRKQQKRVMDSLSVQLKPVLKEDQLKKLNDWHDRNKESSN